MAPKVVKSASGSVSRIVVVDLTAPPVGNGAPKNHLPYFDLATVPLENPAAPSCLAASAWAQRNPSSFRMDQARRLFSAASVPANTGAAVHKGWARRSLARLFPQIGDVQFECEWYGKIGMTDNALPRFHRFAPNVVGFSGYNGRGIAPGTVFGKALAAHILGRVAEADLPLPLTDPRDASFRAIKEMWYEAGAQIAHLADARF